MISTISTSFKVLTLYNASAKSKLATAFTSQLRNIHLQHPMLKSIEEKLGIAEKPKRPSSAYFRFMNEVRPSVQSKNPKLSLMELTSVMGKMWTSLEASKKDKFVKAYNDEMVTYTDRLAKYKEGLSEDDIRAMKEAKATLKEKKIALTRQKKIRSLGRPKRPMSSFLVYLQKQTDRKPNEEYKTYVKRVSAKWQSLSKSEQDRYKPLPKEVENYRKALAQWETKMKKLGHYDIVSDESIENIAPPASSKPRTRKSTSE